MVPASNGITAVRPVETAASLCDAPMKSISPCSGTLAAERFKKPAEMGPTEADAQEHPILRGLNPSLWLALTDATTRGHWRAGFFLQRTTVFALHGAWVLNKGLE